MELATTCQPRLNGVTSAYPFSQSFHIDRRMSIPTLNALAVTVRNPARAGQRT